MGLSPSLSNLSCICSIYRAYDYDPHFKKGVVNSDVSDLEEANEALASDNISHDDMQRVQAKKSRTSEEEKVERKEGIKESEMSSKAKRRSVPPKKMMALLDQNQLAPAVEGVGRMGGDENKKRTRGHDRLEGEGAKVKVSRSRQDGRLSGGGQRRAAKRKSGGRLPPVDGENEFYVERIVGYV